MVYVHVGSLLAEFAPAVAEAGEEFAAVAAAGHRGGKAVVEDCLLLPFEGDATEPAHQYWVRPWVMSVLSGGQVQLEVVSQELRQPGFDRLGWGLGSDESEQVVVGVADLPQPPEPGIAGVTAR